MIYRTNSTTWFTKKIYNYKAEDLRVLVFKELEFVYQLAKTKGSLRTNKPGVDPVPQMGDYTELFTRGTR